MNKNDAIKLAEEYHKSCDLAGTVTDEAKFYEAFSYVEGPVWTVKALLPNSRFEGHGYMQIIVSVKEKKAVFIFNSSGFPSSPHLPPVRNEELEKYLEELDENE